jgi:hypothetical protein
VLGSIYRESTEAFPNGLPRDGEVTLKRDQNEPVAVFADSLALDMAPGLGLALVLAAKEDNPNDPEVKELDLSRLVGGTAYAYHFGFTLLGQFSITAFINMAETNSKTPADYNQLPRDFREQIAQIVKELRASR